MVIQASHPRHGYVSVMVDDADEDAVSSYCWQVNSRGYVVGRVDKKLILLHRHLLNPPGHMVIDHINHNKLDNRRQNLRICTRRENAANRISFVTLRERRINRNNSSGYSGVHSYRGRFKVVIRGKRYGPLYETAPEAAAARTELLMSKKFMHPDSPPAILQQLAN